MKELKIMLDYEAGKKLEHRGKIQYMEIEIGSKKENEFKKRPVLPSPSGI